MRPTIAIESVNVGAAGKVIHGDTVLTTGIGKRPVEGAVAVGEFGLDGDAIVDQEHHGGRDQAVYAYRSEDYDWWSQLLGRDCTPGLFGENLTISGLPADMLVGDRLLIGDVVLEVTSARIPCSTLAARMQDSGFGITFRRAERPGYYFRVLNPGQVQAGDGVEIVECGHATVTVLDLFRFAYQTSHDPERLQQFLDAPIAERVRARVESLLADQERV